MSWENVYVLALALSTIVLLALEKAHLSTIGVGLIVAVAAPGLVAPEQAIAGLATPALVTIAALFVVGEGFLRTGAASMVADRVLRGTGSSEGSVVFLVMAMAAALSAFVNNTLVVVTFLPVITTICRETGFFPSRLLIPLSYASIVGGMCTLVGTSTNLLVSGTLTQLGEPPLRMFTISPAGLLLAGVGVLYLGLLGRRLLPRIRSLSTQMGSGSVKEYVMEITVGRDSPLIGQPVDQVGRARTDGGAKTMMLVRRENALWPPFTSLAVEPGDVLMLGGPIQDLTQLQKAAADSDGESDSYDPGTMSFFELALAPSSTYVGQRIGQLRLKRDFGAAVVAVERSGRHIRERVSRMSLQGGDVLLVFGDDRSKAYLRQSKDFNVIEGVHESILHTDKAPWAFAIITVVILLFVTGAVHHSVAALVGALAMTLTGCLSVHETHRAVNWPIILFISGMIALSKGLDATGTTELMAQGMRALIPGQDAFPLLVAVFVGTVVLTEFLTNNAVAVLMTPLAVELSRETGFDHWPFVMAVALGASCCFANPLGYQTNLMVLGPGGYRFRHFVKVGLPLDLLLITTGILTIPLIWPLQPAPPRVAWHTEARTLVPPLAAVAGGAAVELEVELPRPSWIYVASYAPAQGTLALFPSEQLAGAPDNPLPVGRHHLPGSRRGEPLRWPIAPDVGSLSFMVLVSDHALPDVEQALAHLQQVGNRAFEDRSMSTYAPAAGMGAVPDRGELPAGLLGAAYELTELPDLASTVALPGWPGVYVTTLKVAVE